MNRYILDGARMTTRSDAHDEIACVLALPAHYGRNLDALWDEITTMKADIILANPAALLNGLGDYGEKLIATLREAAQENPRLTFEIRA